MIPRRIFTDGKLNANEIALVCIIINSYPCWLSIGGFSKRSGLCKTKIKELIKNMAAKGLIRRVRVNYRKVYTITQFESDFFNPSFPSKETKSRPTNRAPHDLSKTQMGRNTTINGSPHGHMLGRHTATIDTPDRNLKIERENFSNFEEEEGNQKDRAMAKIKAILGNHKHEPKSQLETVFGEVAAKALKNQANEGEGQETHPEADLTSINPETKELP